MKDYVLKDSAKSSIGNGLFLSGLVFGFDVGTGSIGYAVRKGADFKDVGVLICDSEGSDLSKRRDLRRQRRTLRSRKYRRQWFTKELIKLGLPRPEQPPHDPISLRLRALNGDQLKSEELHAALTHLFKRRGYSKVPWANVEKASKENTKPKKGDEEGKIKAAVAEITQKLDGRHPCQFLADEQARVGKSPIREWARKIYWPREVLRDEFLAIAKAQKSHIPKLVEKADWLLYGDTKEVKGHHVYFKTTEAGNPGVLGLRWPRFDNRGPALDSLQPVDEQGRPLHVVRKNKQSFTRAQWELALMNFRVLDAKTRQKLDPRIHFPIFIENLRNEWNKKKNGISIKRLGQLATPFADKFLLIENQKALTPETGAGRARYSSPTLELIRKEIGDGRRIDPPQPVLRRKGETAEQALNRYLTDTKHPLVRHRLALFKGILGQLVRDYGQPDMIILEAVRSLALGQKAKNELNKRNETFRKERENAREALASNKESTSRKAIQRYRLWLETKGRCPFCLQTIERSDLGHGADIEHLVPRSTVDCNEFYNLTVAHIKCNRELKGEHTPFDAFGGTSQWSDIKDNAEKTFSGRKLEIFLSPNAEELIEQKADLQHTAYIARVIRHVSLIQLGWLGKDGRDPTPEKQNAALAFQVTNGHLTSRLRKAWGLNQILHPLPADRRWDELSEEEQKQFSEKNRGDLRHHALDAMVIACTLPWLAHRTHGAKDEFGNHGWWTQDEKQRSKAANPLFPKDGQMHDVVKKEIEKVVVRHHVAKGDKRKFFDTTRYGKRGKDLYIARKVLAKMNPKQLAKVYPGSQSAYLLEAWKRFESENPSIDALLKEENRGKDPAEKVTLPGKFISRLCFSDYQRWEASQKTQTPLPFTWAKSVTIPFKSVSVIADDGDNAMFETTVGSKTYVSQTEFKEVRVYLPPNGKKFITEFVRPWIRKNSTASQTLPEGSKFICRLRKGDVLVMAKGDAGKRIEPGSRWILKKTFSGGRVSILPSHLSNNRDVLVALGFDPINFLRISITDLMRAIGHELPHSPSVKPQPESPHQA